MVRSEDELIDFITNLEMPEDKKIDLLEDVTDTIKNTKEIITEEWEEKYKENNEIWKEKYLRRFNNSEFPTPVNNPVEQDKFTGRIEDLFKEG